MKTRRDKRTRFQSLAAEQKNNLLQDLMDLIPDVIYFKDKMGKILMVNQAHAKGLGVKPHEVIGKTDFDFFPRARALAMAKDDAQVLKTGKPILDKIERATRPDGVDNYVSTTKIPRFNRNNEVIGLIGITRDITRRMQMELLDKEREKIEKKLHALEELNKLTSEFVSVASHELRTPLAIVKEAVMLMHEGIAGALNDKQRNLLATAIRNIENLKNIIEELLDVSRIESGRFKLRYSLVNLNDLLNDNFSFFQKKALEKGVGLKYLLPRRELNLFLDAEKINRVVTNLVNNAIKFTEPGGKITLEGRVFENKIRIGVIDTGIGIPKADREKIFNKFIQVCDKAASRSEGLGLGLSIAKGIIQQHGGEIWAESKPGLGSKFYFTLPFFYRTNMLEKPARLRINNLIDRGISGYLIHLMMINYSRLKRTIKVPLGGLFRDLRAIIDELVERYYRPGRERPDIFSIDTKTGQISIIFPQLKDSEVTALCDTLKKELRQYFTKISAEDVFINLGLLSYPQSAPSGFEEFPASLHIKKIFIGQEIRRFRRFYYRLDVNVDPCESPAYLSQTVDISRGGLCFVSVKPLKTDSRININLALNNSRDAMRIPARVAWINDLAQNSFKIGTEFLHLRQKDKQILAKFINTLTK